MEPQASHDPATQEVWLGYDGLSARYAEISALLVYMPAWERRIVQQYGSLPSGIQSVVLLKNGRILPARRTIDDLRQRMQVWREQYGKHEASSVSEATHDQ